MNIDQIIAKVFSGKATQEELDTLTKWKNEAEENIKAIKEMRAIDHSISEMKDYKEFDIDEAWITMEEKMNSPSQEKTPQEIPIEENTIEKSYKSLFLILGFLLLSFLGWKYFANASGQDNKPKVIASVEQVTKSDLADGTQVTLDNNTTLTPKANRAVGLDGRAHFNVTKSKTDQFVVETHTGSITVLGTQFVVDTRDNQVKIYVIEGNVRYDLGNRHVELGAGDKMTLNDGEIIRVRSKGVEMTSWMSPDKLSFRNESLAVVVEAINKRFGSNIVIDIPKQVEKCKVNTTIEKESLSDVLNELTHTLGLKYNTIEGVMHIVASDC